MAITYAELVTLINDTIQSDDEATFETHVDDFIDQSEDLIIKNCQIPPMTKMATGSLTLGNEHLALPSDYIAPLQFTVISGTTRYQLKVKEASFLTAAFPSTSASDRARPKYYSPGDNATTSQLRMRPVPDSAYTYELEYSSRPASLIDGASDGTTWISANMKNALVYGSLMHAALYIRDFEGAEKYKQQFMDATGLSKIEQEGKARTDRRRREYARPNVQE